MAYDMTVRDSGGHVVQFEYGADNLDPTDMEGKKGETVDFNRILNHVKVTLLNYDANYYIHVPYFEVHALFRSRTIV